MTIFAPAAIAAVSVITGFSDIIKLNMQLPSDADKTLFGKRQKRRENASARRLSFLWSVRPLLERGKGYRRH